MKYGNRTTGIYNKNVSVNLSKVFYHFNITFEIVANQRAALGLKQMKKEPKGKLRDVFLYVQNAFLHANTYSFS